MEGNTSEIRVVIFPRIENTNKSTEKLNVEMNEVERILIFPFISYVK